MELDITLDKLETNRYPKVVASRMLQVSLLLRLVIASGLFAMAASEQQLTLEIKDYATLPITGSPERVTDNVASLLARINFLREEPGGKRFFVNDLNGPLYIIDRATKKVTTYLDFNGREGHGGLFHKFRFENGQGNGFLNFFFDPDYVHNGKFYTIHLEDPSLPGATMPDNTWLCSVVPPCADLLPQEYATRGATRPV